MQLYLFSVLALASQCLYGQPLQQGNAQKDRLGAAVSPHLSCIGVGSPIVIRAAAAVRGAADWAKVKPTVGEMTQVCSYDRHADHCCDEVIDDLRSALREASLPGPYVFVGHSLGGLYVRRFADRFPDAVAGLVLVGSADEKQIGGIIAPGIKPELYRPGEMSDSETQAFFKDLGQRMVAAGTAPASDSTSESKGEDSGEIRLARFYRQIAADRHDFMFSEK